MPDSFAVAELQYTRVRRARNPPKGPRIQEREADFRDGIGKFGRSRAQDKHEDPFASLYWSEQIEPIGIRYRDLSR